MTDREIQLQAEIEALKVIIEEKDREIEELKKKNQRNAGRKPADDKWVAGFNAFIKCYESQKSINETMRELNISRSTYYRYKRLYNDTTVSSEN